MSLYTIKTTHRLPIPIGRAWDFFSSPHNLEAISPGYLDFRITSDGAGEKMYPGMIISYSVKPILKIPLTWVTEITHVKDREYFVDEQRFGPYALWHHKHFFQSIDGGVEMTDIIHYKLPFGFLGKMAHTLFVRKQIKDIFEYRTQKMIELFGSL